MKDSTMLRCVALVALLIYGVGTPAVVGTGDNRTPQWDPSGYVFFCLCMGRFGNQMDHLLGGMAFAKALNRTLVLPAFRTYRNVRFTEWFRKEPLEQFHRVILAEDFMEHLAAQHWPPGQRTGWCWLPASTTETKCAMKDGSPFGPFWDGYGVDFADSMVYHLSYDSPQAWLKKYPATKYPVMAFKGAPAAFPVLPKHRPLQRFLHFSDKIEKEAENYIRENFPDDKFVGLHLRNGPDWTNACEQGKNLNTYMASPQCLEKTDQKVTKKLCLPSEEEVLRLTKKIVQKIKAKVVYVATDKDPMVRQLQQHLQANKVRVFHADPMLPLVDLSILIKSDYFIGNCVSSFTAFVTRARSIYGKPTEFWGFS